MVAKYARKLKDRLINDDTGSTWAIQDVPPVWRSKTETKVISDGYYFDEDGTARKNEPNE
jgi:hypothetical protein